MILGAISGILLALLLELTGFDVSVINVLQEFTDIQITNEIIYVLLGAIGAISGAFR